MSQNAKMNVEVKQEENDDPFDPLDLHSHWETRTTSTYISNDYKKEKDPLEIPEEVNEEIEDMFNDQLPKKSKETYEREYIRFQSWCKENKKIGLSEKILLAYFKWHSKDKKSSTLWTIYSMLRCCLNIKTNVDIKNYPKLIAFLKSSLVGYEPKKSQILQLKDIDRFIDGADDSLYLAIKVILIMGYNGACRRDELTNMLIDHVEFKTNSILVTIPSTASSRIFSITNKLWIDKIKKYVSLRSKKIKIARFFLTYRNGTCISTPIGVNMMGKAPYIIAKYLKLPNPEEYTGHCFRRSSVSQSANKNGCLVTVKHDEGWKYSQDIENYIQTALKKTVEVAEMMANKPSTSSIPQSTESASGNSGTHQSFVFNQKLPKKNADGQDVCHITVNIYNNCTIVNKS